MAKEESWLETQYNRYGADILRYLARHFSPAASAEDLLQETFIQAMTSPKRPEEITSPLAWLLGIARNVGLMAMRRRHISQPLPNDLCDPETEGSDPRLEAMRRALSELPEPYREILELRLMHQVSYDELASILGVPVGTVRSRLHYAVRQLKDRMTGGDVCR